MNGWMLDSELSYTVVSNCGEFVVFHLGIVGGQERPFYSILEAETVLCTAWIGPASGSSIYPEAEGTPLPATGALLPGSVKKLNCLRKQCFLLQVNYFAQSFRVPSDIFASVCSVVLMFLSAGPIAPPPQECLPSERTKTAETGALMDAQANYEVETKKAIT
ncbi:hypothetical protein HPG69_018666 [Diceros bicornis minor]|uniref:Uncharacterized protein n=1 Tax=Diceros bicornis minor TaxID=77932 RepID=A0A7J7F0N0_DICBM|nr:hypothetical protein HPG69_018666 [Diceros bicornis minor]